MVGTSQSMLQPWQSWTKAMETVSQSSHPTQRTHSLAREPFQVLHSRIPEFCCNPGCSFPVRILFQQTLRTKEVMPAPGPGHPRQNNDKLESCTEGLICTLRITKANSKPDMYRSKTFKLARTAKFLPDCQYLFQTMVGINIPQHIMLSETVTSKVMNLTDHHHHTRTHTYTHVPKQI